MILTDKQIIALQASEHPLISPFDETKLRGTSYDITLDDEIRTLEPRAGVIDLAVQESIDYMYSTPYSLSGFILKPNQYCLAALNEVITLPDDVVAFVAPRTRFTRLGLLVVPQFCNASYRGRLRIGLHNASGNNIKLAPKMGIAQLVFEQLESVPSASRLYRNQRSAAYQDEESFIGAQVREELSDGAKAIFDRLVSGLDEVQL